MIYQCRALKLLDTKRAAVAVFGDFHRYIFGGLSFSGQIDNTGISGYHNGRTVLLAIIHSLFHQRYEFLDLVSRRIINEVPDISRVAYDISGKPPATIEWE